MLSHKNKFSGVLTALITPFYKNKIDFDSLKSLLTHQLKNGTSGFVVSGTTGESPTLESNEVQALYKYVRKNTPDHLPVLLGTGSNSTAKTVLSTRVAKKLGADAALIVCPYYNKPTQEGIALHYEKIANEVKMPIVLYDAPARTVVSIAPETILRLSKNKNIVGIKDATGSVDHLSKIRRKVNNRFLCTSGDDNSSLQYILSGGHGVISVISHVIPQEFSDLVKRALAGDKNVLKEYHKYTALNKLLGIETNPIPVKTMLFEMNIIRSPELRLPLCEPDPKNRDKIIDELRRLRIVRG